MSDYNYLARGIGPALQEGASARYAEGRAQAVQDENQGAKNAAPFLAAAMKGDPAAIAAIGQQAPHLLQHIYPALTRMDAQRAAHMDRVAGHVGDQSAAILAAPEAEQAGLYAAHLAQMKALGVPGVENWPQTWGTDAKNLTTLEGAHAKNWREFRAPAKAPKASGGGGGGGGEILWSPGDAQPSAAGKTSDAGPPVADAPTQIAGEPTAPPDAPVVAQATPPPGPSGPPPGFTPMGIRVGGNLVAANLGGQPLHANLDTGEVYHPTIGGAAPPNAMGEGGGEALSSGTAGDETSAPFAPPVQMAQATPPQAAPAAPAKPAPPAYKEQWDRDPNHPFNGGYKQIITLDKRGNRVPLIEDGKEVFVNPKTNARIRYEFKPPAASEGAANIDPSLTGDDVYAALPPARAAEIKSIVNGDNPIPPPTARTPYAQETRNLVFQAGGPEFTNTLHASRMDMRKKLNGKLGDALTTQGTLYNHLEELQKTGEELQNTPYPFVNKVGNWIGLNSGDPRVSNMITVKHRVNEELEKYFNGTGGTTVSGMAEAQKELNEAQAPEQLEGAVAKINKLVTGRQDEVLNQINRGMGYNGDKQLKPEDLLSPAAIKARDNVANRLKEKTKPTAAAEPPSGAPAVRRYNPDTGKIE